MTTLLRTQWDRVAAAVAAAFGAVLLVIGWVKVSHTAYPAEQIPYLASAGLGALFLLGLAGSLWISADLRDEYAKLDEIARGVTGHGLPEPDRAPSVVPATITAVPSDVPVEPPRRSTRAAARSATSP